MADNSGSTNSTILTGYPVYAFEGYDNSTYGNITPAGNFSMTAETAVSGSNYTVMVSFSPVVTATGLSGLLELMGVGT